MGKGKEILLRMGVEEMLCPWDRRSRFGLIRVHEFQACEIPMLWRSYPAVWFEPGILASLGYSSHSDEAADHLQRL